MAEEVAPGIFRIGLRRRNRIAPFSVSVYVIAGEDGLVFDGGLGGRKAGRFLHREIRSIEATMAARGIPCSITRVLPSHGHWDHFSGVAYMKKHLGLTVLSTPKMFESMGSRSNYRESFWKEREILRVHPSRWKRWAFSIVRFFSDELFFRMYGVTFVPGPYEAVHAGQVLLIGGEPWELMSMPGHCDDDVVLFNRERGILLSGDIVLRSLNTWIGPPRSNLARYIDTLERLKALPGITLILPSHGSPVTEPYKRLEAAADHRRKRILAVIDIIKNSGPEGICFEKIFKTFYPSSTIQERYVAQGWILLTLMDLVEKNVVSSVVRGRNKLFRIMGTADRPD